MLSVIIPAHNSANTLEECLKAVRQSTVKDIEIIVSDDGSTDATAAIAGKQADIIVNLGKNYGTSTARTRGAEKAGGDILVFIDSDILVRDDTLELIDRYFRDHPGVDAITGRLALEHPNSEFFSIYKNAYMNFIFGELPDRVEFIYGSIFAIRRNRFLPFSKNERIAEDAAWGHRISSQGRSIIFLKELEVVHLKKHDFKSWSRNDFIIPYAMARPFLLFKGWRQFRKKGIGFSHVPKHVLLSICLIYSLPSCLLFPVAAPQISGGILAGWFVLNVKFIYFLSRNYGLKFGLLSVPVTLYDHLVMGFGVLCGLSHSLIELARKKS